MKTAKKNGPGNPLLRVCGLNLSFGHGISEVQVLKDINLKVEEGEILGLMGESGCGKSVLAKTLLRLEFPGRIFGGSIRLAGVELTEKSTRVMKKIRGRDISLVLQDPLEAMDPLFRMSRQFRDSGVREENLEMAGISYAVNKYPHQWSRGMLQRAQMVMALASSPRLLVLDEVTSALDPTVCVQILEIVAAMKKNRGMGIIFITHDPGTVLEICDRVAVMRDGEIVERGKTVEVFNRPHHEYTKQLISAYEEY